GSPNDRRYVRSKYCSPRHRPPSPRPSTPTYRTGGPPARGREFVERTFRARGHKTPCALKRSPPASCKRLLGGADPWEPQGLGKRKVGAWTRFGVSFSGTNRAVTKAEASRARPPGGA